MTEAEAACRRVLSRRPSDPDALQLLGVLALHAGRLDEAVDALRRALGVRPAWAEAYNNLGVALEARGQWVKAENAFRAAARLEPTYLQPRLNLGNVLRAQGRPADAADAYRSASRLRPDDPGPYCGLGAVCLEMGLLNEGLTHYRRSSDLQPQSASAHSDLLFWMMHDPKVGPRALFDEHVRRAERHEWPLRSNSRAAFGNDKHPDRPLRVGYVSPDFREHPVARFIEPVLAGHDPAHVVPVCYSDVARPDAVTARLRASVPEWRDASGVTDDELAALIRRDRIDILVDLTGHMGGSRLPLFARRPAPVRATYMGYPYSTGMSSMDWRITDEASDPTGATEQYNSERLMRLEGCAFCYRPTESPPVAELPACATGAVTFGVFNRMAKVNAGAAATWARVLAAVPNSRLVVLAPRSRRGRRR
jgi:predicted O-linked N-acetylglucosamine transferase (SPINDLY family)